MILKYTTHKVGNRRYSVYLRHSIGSLRNFEELETLQLDAHHDRRSLNLIGFLTQENFQLKCTYVWATYNRLCNGKG